MSTVHIVVVGANGRMGTRIGALAAEDPAFALRVGIVPEAPRDDADGPAAKYPFATWQTAFSYVENGDVIIDFSSPRALRDSIDLSRRRGAALLVGTTGIDFDAIEELRALSSERAVLLAPNTSVGVAVCCDTVARIARLLGPSYRCGIVEAHHVHKKDAPSGTAKRLATSARAGGADLPEDQIVSLRSGDVIGEHTVRFAGSGEYIELTHRATTRDLFARGALSAARWLASREPGWYTIEDVIGLPRT